MNNSLESILALLNGQTVDFTTIQPDNLLSTANSHRLTNHVYRKLLTASSTPTELIQKFKLEVRQNQHRALLQLQSLLALQQLLQRHNIPALFLKGLLLSQQLYGDISLRQVRDIDLLVAKDTVMSVDKLLRDHGYQPFEHELNQKYLTPLLFTYKDTAYLDPTHNTIIELHWYLDNPYTFNVPFTQLWQDRRIMQLSNHDFNTLSAEDEWLYLCNHGSRHAWFRLHWLYDIAQHPQALATPKKSLQEKAKQYGVNKHLDLAFFMLKNYFPKVCPPDHPIKNRPSQFMQTTVLRQIELCHAPLENSNVSTTLNFDQLRYVVFSYLIYRGLRNKWYTLSNQVRLKYFAQWMERGLPSNLFFLCYFKVVAYALYRPLTKIYNFLKIKNKN